MINEPKLPLCVVFKSTATNQDIFEAVQEFTVSLEVLATQAVVVMNSFYCRSLVLGLNTLNHMNLTTPRIHMMSLWTVIVRMRKLKGSLSQHSKPVPVHKMRLNSFRNQKPKKVTI